MIHLSYDVTPDLYIFLICMKIVLFTTSTRYGTRNSYGQINWITRALYDFGKYRTQDRFVPDKAFARSQLAQLLIQRALLAETPIFMAKVIRKDMPDMFHQLVMPDGQLSYVRTGIPSGLCFAQNIGSVTNLTLIHMLQDDFGCSPETPTQVPGDDLIFALLQVLFTFKEAKSFIDQFGIVLRDKTTITKKFNEIVSLGYNV